MGSPGAPRPAAPPAERVAKEPRNFKRPRGPISHLLEAWGFRSQVSPPASAAFKERALVPDCWGVGGLGSPENDFRGSREK